MPAPQMYSVFLRCALHAFGAFKTKLFSRRISQRPSSRRGRQLENGLEQVSALPEFYKTGWERFRNVPKALVGMELGKGSDGVKVSK